MGCLVGETYNPAMYTELLFWTGGALVGLLGLGLATYGFNRKSSIMNHQSLQPRRHRHFVDQFPGP